VLSVGCDRQSDKPRVVAAAASGTGSAKVETQGLTLFALDVGVAPNPDGTIMLKATRSVWPIRWDWRLHPG